MNETPSAVATGSSTATSSVDISAGLPGVLPVSKGPPSLGASPAAISSAGEVVKPKPGALSERHHKYAEEFKQWLLGLNRHDFGMARRVLEQMTRAYFKHTIKVHSPPMKDEQNDVSGTKSQGAPDLDVPAGDQPA